MTSKIPEDRMRGEGGYGNVSRNLKIIIPFAKGYWRLAIIGSVFLFITFLFNLPQPLVFRFLIDKVILAKNLELLAWTICIWVGLLGGTRIASIIQKYFFTRFKQKVIIKIQKALLQRTFHFPKAFFDKTRTGYLMSRLTSDIYDLEWFFSGNVISMVNQILRFIGGIIFLFYLEWRIAVPVVISIPITWLSSWYFAKRMYILNHRQKEQGAQLSQHLQEALSTTSLIKTFSTEKKTTGKLVGQLKKILNLDLEQFFVGILAQTGNSLAFSTVKIFVLIFGAHWVIKGNWSLGSMLAFQSYLAYVFGPAMFLITSNQIFQNARTSLERVCSIFDILPEDQVGIGKPVKSMLKSIEFKDVTFAYTDEPVLQNISLKIDKGSHVAIIGHSGVGKTTFVSLLMRFYIPQEGDIKIGKTSIKEYEILSYRRKFGYVAQGNLLNSGTILDNLFYGHENAKKSEIYQAAKTAKIHDFITNLKDGYRTEIGEKGVALSEGQRQRLCIARALVKNPDILILDEPTSAVDNETESSILSKIKEVCGNKTIFIVAHQLNCVKDVDRIILLEDKGIVADGAHDELMKTSPEYQQFFNTV